MAGCTTPLHIAASQGDLNLVKQLLLKNGQATINSRDEKWQTPLHRACSKGHLCVMLLLLNNGADFHVRDMQNDLPLHKAAFNGHKDIVCALINEFGCNPSVKGFHDRTLLHHACNRGHLELIDMLISKFNNDPLARDKDGDTPLHIAALAGQVEAANLLITKYKCPVDSRDNTNLTPLHCACGKGHLSVVKILVIKHKADLTACSTDNDTPLHKAALFGHKDIVCALINEFDCNPRVKGFQGRTLLHHACARGHIKLVQTIVEQFEPVYGLLLLSDDSGNTPLHISSIKGKTDCARFLLYECHAPVFIRNKAGKSAIDASSQHIQSLFTNYLKSQQSFIQEEYKALQEKSAKKFSGAQLITRVFVLGNPQAGKSTLVESLKREGLFDYFPSIASSHTSGIVPSVYKSYQCGRLLFYDFAGDTEYYSSHAAILERVALSSKGVSVYLLVVNVSNQEKQIKEELGYWLSFVTFHSKSIEMKTTVQIVASHADKESSLQHKLQTVEDVSLQFEQRSQGVIGILPVISLNCRYPKTAQMKILRDALEMQSTKQSPCSLSLEATILHGLLEKDFQNVTACKVQKILTHIEETGICLPKNVKQLYSILTRLHDIGLLMIIGRNNDKLKDHCLILNPSELTNEVHKTLFSDSDTSSALRLYYTTGIIPEAKLQKILPEYITTECLVQLQYCQELSHIDIGLDTDYPITVNESTTSSDKYFYFPALCKQESPESLLPAGLFYKIGWYAECTNEFEYFPPRFMHVLLLRLANAYALPSCGEHSDHCQRRCNMWTNGLKWQMEEGVTCSVEIVKASRGVVVITGSTEELAEECTTMLAKIVSKILETKAEYCHLVELHLYLVATQESDINHFDPEDKGKLFLVEEVNRAVKQGQFTVVSADHKGQQTLDHSVLCHIGKHTYWGEFTCEYLYSMITLLGPFHACR